MNMCENMYERVYLYAFKKTCNKWPKTNRATRQRVEWITINSVSHKVCSILYLIKKNDFFFEKFTYQKTNLEKYILKTLFKNLDILFLPNAVALGTLLFLIF